jgi:hypothetical protein
MIDLTKPGSNVLEDKDAAESSKNPPEEEDKRTKLASFQCVICMDDAKVITATHCGKCQPPLQQALTSPAVAKFPNRSSLLRAVSTFLPARRVDKGQMPHVPRQDRPQTSRPIHTPHKGLLPAGAEVYDKVEEGKAEGE